MKLKYILLTLIVFILIGTTYAQLRMHNESERELIYLTVYPDSTGFEYVTRYEKWWAEYTDVIIEKYIYRVQDNRLVFIEKQNANVQRQQTIPESYQFELK